MNTKSLCGVLVVATASIHGASVCAATQSEAVGVNSSITTFRDDLAFLQKHTKIIVLGGDAKGSAQIALAPAWQGRVMTSTAKGPSGRSLGWINRDLIASEKLVPHMNVFGGEERFWIGPEGGQFSIFHAKDGGFGWDNWQVPPPLDSLPFATVSHSNDRAIFQAHFSLANYSGTHFRVGVQREVRLLDAKTAWERLGLPPSTGVSLVAYESHNTLTNEGHEPWRKETGLLSIWIAGMHPSSPSATFVAPIRLGSPDDLGPAVTSDYFGAVGPDRLRVTDHAIYFRVDAQYQSKLGISPRRSLEKFGTYDPEHQVLTIVQFSRPPGATDYVKSLWRLQDQPYTGDAINVYNDGSVKPGAKSFGPFYELESSSPAAALAPGANIEHTHRTIHLTGAKSELDAVSRAVLGVSLAQITTAFAEAPRRDSQKAVLVTGASTGIGRKITERLASEGYFVYAGARKEVDLQALSSIKNVRGVRLDVTNMQDIAEAVSTIRQGGLGLYGLVNNAGIFSMGNVADYKPEEFDLVMAVNVAGPFRVTQAFLPLIEAQKGRIVTIGSITGFLACPGVSVYCMSKHAVEAFTDALAGEMEPLGVKVSVIEPGQYKSAIWSGAAERGNVDRKAAEQWTSERKDPDEVAAAAVLALREEKPKRRYLVVPNPDEADIVIRNQVTRLVQVNEDQPYTYDRERLIAILDEALAHEKPRTIN